MKLDVIQNGTLWWSWIETCDKCGKLIRTHANKSSRKPDMKESDFCIECLRYFLDNKIHINDSESESIKKSLEQGILPPINTESENIKGLYNHKMIGSNIKK